MADEQTASTYVTYVICGCGNDTFIDFQRLVVEGKTVEWSVEHVCELCGSGCAGRDGALMDERRLAERPANLVTYFGGYASAIQEGDRRVHIFRDGDRETFCGLVERCGYGTPRIVGQFDRRSCETCFRVAQKERRDG